MKIALAGNPNSGKTSLFNSLTGLNQKVGNYPGVTVEKKTGTFSLPDGTEVFLTDLPGIYSLHPRSEDELVASGILLNPESPDYPDLLILVIDASNLKRNLLLASQVAELGIPCLFAINMLDVAEQKGLAPNLDAIELKFGVPVVGINARKQKGINLLKEKLASPIGATEKKFFQNPENWEQIKKNLKANFPKQSDYGLFHLLCGVEKHQFLTPAQKPVLLDLKENYSLPVTAWLGEDVLHRYKVLNEWLPELEQHRTQKTQPQWTSQLDYLLTHRVWGYAIFASTLFLVFQAIYSWSELPMTWIEQLFDLLGQTAKEQLPEHWLTDLLTDGVLAGLGGIMVFIPQIMILFGFLTIMEETGYMSRVSFMMDKIFRKFGLSGKSVLPLMSGVACAIPAIMSARNIENYRERMLTILVTPLMSCSARLPVFTLLISLSVPSQKVAGYFNLQGLVLMGFYLLGTVAAFVLAFFLKRFVKSREESLFVLELPVYRPPRWKNVFLTMFLKAKIFVVEAGKVIIVVSMILWFLASYGPSEKMEAAEMQVAEMNLPEEEEEQALASARLQASYAGSFGRWIEPAIRPLGFDWKIGIALLTSFAAREVYVGTMATLYNLGEAEGSEATLRQKMMADTHPETGKPIYSLATVFSLLLFYAFAMQCVSTLAIVRRETNSWKWPVFILIYLSVLAWSASFVAFQVLSRWSG